MISQVPNSIPYNHNNQIIKGWKKWMSWDVNDAMQCQIIMMHVCPSDTHPLLCRPGPMGATSGPCICRGEWPDPSNYFIFVAANDPTHRYHNICRGDRPDPSNHISTGKDLGPYILFLTHFHTQNKCKYAHFGMDERDVNFTNKFIHTYQPS